MKKNLLKIALSALLVAVVLVGGTLAYLVTGTDLLTNTFAVVKIDTEVEEEPNTVKAPWITNTTNSNVAVYVRAVAVVSTEAGSSVPVSSGDVTFTYLTSETGWKEYDGYYYYMQPLDPGQSTTELFHGVTVSDELDNGAKFSVYVYHESVQAKDDGLSVEQIAALFG